MSVGEVPQRMGREVVVNEDLRSSVGPEHNVNTM